LPPGAAPRVAWPVEGGRRWVAWVTDDAAAGMNGVIAAAENDDRDRFAHACAPVVIRRSGSPAAAEPVVEPVVDGLHDRAVVPK
jgi:hypothetical protein